MKKNAIEFFLYNQGGRYPVDATAEQRAECDINQATRLAVAEHWAWDNGYTFEWSIDEGYDSSEWSDEQPAYEQYNCAMCAEDHRCVQSLGGIDFGRGHDPWTVGEDRKLSYRRLVEAELALEQMELCTS